MKHNHHFILVLFLILVSCKSPNNNSKQESVEKSKIPNGLYLVLNEYGESKSRPTTGYIIPYNHDLLDDDQFGQHSFLEIDTAEFVRFDLAREPEGVEQEDKKINLLLTLSDGGKIQLANFTEKHLNQTVAIVVGGKAVTRHKVKAKIEGGNLQITRCTDSGCKFLLVALKEGLKK